MRQTVAREPAATKYSQHDCSQLLVLTIKLDCVPALFRQSL